MTRYLAALKGLSMEPVITSHRQLPPLLLLLTRHERYSQAAILMGLQWTAAAAAHHVRDRSWAWK